MLAVVRRSDYCNFRIPARSIGRRLGCFEKEAKTLCIFTHGHVFWCLIKRRKKAPQFAEPLLLMLVNDGALGILQKKNFPSPMADWPNSSFCLNRRVSLIAALA